MSTTLAGPTPAPHLERIADAAARIGVHPATIRRWVATGLLPAIRRGPRLIYVNPADVDAVASRPVVAARGGDAA